MALKADSGKRIPGIVGRRYADHDTGVRIALVARILAHAVGDHPPGLGSGGDYGTARAHAKTVNRTAVGAVMHELVIGGTELRVAGVLAIARPVDQRLRMLDT